MFATIDSSSALSDVVVKIKADIANFVANFSKATASMKQFASQVDMSNKEVKTISGGLTSLSGILVGVGVSLNAGLGISAIRTFANFQQSMANTFSVIGNVSDAMGQLTNKARELGTTTIFSAAEAGNAMYYLASAGYKTQQIMDSLEGVLTLAASTQYDLAQTTSTVVNILNTFKLAASESTRVANVFAAVIADSQAEMYKLTDSFRYIGPIAAQLGYTVEQVSAALGILYNAGLEASQAGTYLRGGLINLQKPTKEALIALKSLGLTVEDISPQIHTLNEIIAKFEEVGAGAVDKGDELAAIFDKRATTAFQILIKSGSEAMSELENKITGTNRAMDMMKTQTETLSAQWKILMNNFKEVGITIGTTLSPILKELTNRVKDAITTYIGWSDTTKSAITNTSAFVIALTSLSTIILVLVSKIPDLIKGLQAFNVVAGISATTVLGWAAIIAIAIGTIYSLVTAEAREKRQLQDNISAMDSYYSTKLREMKLVKSAGEEYLASADKIKEAIDTQKKYTSLITKLSEEYPDVISANDSYADALRKTKNLNSSTAIEFKKLANTIGDVSPTLEKEKKLIVEINTSYTNLVDSSGNIRTSIESMKSAYIYLQLDVEKTKNKLNEVNTELSQTEKSGDKTSETYKGLKKSSEKLTKELSTLESSLNIVNEAFKKQDLKGKITLNTDDIEILKIELASISEQMNKIPLSDTTGKFEKLGEAHYNLLQKIEKLKKEQSELNSVYNEATKVYKPNAIVSSELSDKYLELNTRINLLKLKLANVSEQMNKVPLSDTTGKFEKLGEAHYDLTVQIENAEKEFNNFKNLQGITSSVLNTTTGEIGKEGNSFNGINRLLPTSIDLLSDFKIKQNQVSTATNAATIELYKNEEALKSLNKIKAEIKITEAQEKINELTTDLQDGVSTWEKIWSNAPFIRQFKLVDLNDVKNQGKLLANTITDVKSSISDSALDLPLQVKPSIVNLAELTEKLKVKISIGQSDEVLTDQKNIIDKVREINLKVKKLNSEIITEQNNKKPNEEFISNKQDQIDLYNTEITALTKLGSAYSSALLTNSQIAEQETIILNQKKLLEEIDKPIVTENKSDFVPSFTEDTTEEELKKELRKLQLLEKKKTTLYWDSLITRLEGEKDIKELFSEASLVKAREYIMAEYKLKIANIEKEKSANILAAKEIGIDVLSIMADTNSESRHDKIENAYKEGVDILSIYSSFNRNKLAADLKLQKDLTEMDSTWEKHRLSLLENNIETQQKITKGDLDNLVLEYTNAINIIQSKINTLKNLDISNLFANMHGIILPEMGMGNIKELENELNELHNKLNKTNSDINLLKENEMNFNLDKLRQEFNQPLMDTNSMWFNSPETYTKALQDNKTYLESQLGLYTEWGDKYLSIKRDILAVERELQEVQLLEYRAYIDAATSVTSDTIDYLWNRYINKSREAKNELDALWIAMKNSALKALQEILTSEITKSLLKLLMTIFGIGTGGAGFAIASVAAPAIPISAVGSQVTRPGLMKVHKDEVVVPASIVRKHKSSYENALDGNSTINKSNINNNSISINLVNPVVNDKRYWETVMTDYIEPAIIKLNKR